jgi:hypothetical protein
MPQPGDTHPVLSDRLTALGIEADDATAFLTSGEIEAKGSAAAALLGPRKRMGPIERSASYAM